MVYALVNSQLQQIRANFWKKNTKPTLTCKPDIGKKKVSFEKFRREIDLNFLENVNAQIEDRPNSAGGLELR